MSARALLPLMLLSLIKQDGEKPLVELYDLAKEPLELQNLAGLSASERAALGHGPRTIEGVLKELAGSLHTLEAD